MDTEFVGIITSALVFYFGSAADATGLYLTGIILHGLIFGCFMVGGQIYIDNRTPPELKAQAQGFIFFVTIGLGLLTGNFISGELIEHFSQITGTERVYKWNLIWGIASVCSFVLLLAFLMLFKGEKKKKAPSVQLIEAEKNNIKPELKTI
jgi:MFS family permease